MDQRVVPPYNALKKISQKLSKNTAKKYLQQTNKLRPVSGGASLQPKEIGKDRHGEGKPHLNSTGCASGGVSTP